MPSKSYACQRRPHWVVWWVEFWPRSPPVAYVIGHHAIIGQASAQEETFWKINVASAIENETLS